MKRKSGRYERCVTCAILDEGGCNGPNLSVLTNPEKAAWIAARADHLDLTHLAIAELSNLPKGTVDNVLSGPSPNPKSDTLRLLLHAVGVRDTGDNPCPDPDTIAALVAEAESLRAQLQKGSGELEKAEENAQKKIDYLKKETDFLRESLAHKERLNKALTIAILIFFAVWLLIELVFPNAGFIRY